MKITKLSYQKKNPNRVNVYVDNKFSAGIDANDVVRLGLFAGLELDKTTLAKIIGESEFGKVFNVAVNLLSYRPRSEWEIRTKLKRKLKASPESDKLIAKVIEKLKQIGQINDQEFARWYIEQRNTFRPRGERLLKSELYKKGLTKETIEAVLTAGEGGEGRVSDFSKAMRVLERKFVKSVPTIAAGAFRSPEREKIVRFLASRGFDWDTINEVIEKLSAKE